MPGVGVELIGTGDGEHGLADTIDARLEELGTADARLRHFGESTQRVARCASCVAATGNATRLRQRRRFPNVAVLYVFVLANAGQWAASFPCLKAAYEHRQRVMQNAGDRALMVEAVAEACMTQKVHSEQINVIESLTHIVQASQLLQVIITG